MRRLTTLFRAFALLSLLTLALAPADDVKDLEADRRDCGDAPG